MEALCKKQDSKTLNKGEFLFHVGRVKSPLSKEALIASLGFYLPATGILFALTQGLYSLLGKISRDFTRYWVKSNKICLGFYLLPVEILPNGE